MNIQMKTLITCAVIIMSLSASYTDSGAGERERLADINKILTAYRCLEKGKYHYGSPVVTKVSMGEYSDEISQVEGMKKLLDTPEEFITAAFYSDVDVINEMKDIVRTELPPGKTGALRIASMWLKKCAEDRVNCRKYGVAMDIIKERSEISDPAIREYFSKAIENEIKVLAAGGSPAQLTEKTIHDEICAPIIAYYTHPDKENEKNLVNTGVRLFNENRLKAGAFTATLIKLNDTFATGIIKTIHERRNKSR